MKEIVVLNTIYILYSTVCHIKCNKRTFFSSYKKLKELLKNTAKTSTNKKYIFILLLSIIYQQADAQTDCITTSGIVNDFKGNPIDSAIVELKHSNFQTAYETLSDINGKYNLRAKKGKRMALASIRMDEYPLANSVLPRDKQRLEF